VRAPGSPAPLSIFFNSGATPRRIVRRRGARCIVRAPGGPASTRGPRLGTYCADVRVGASCVPREVQRLSLSLSLSLFLNSGATPRRIVRRLGARRFVRPGKSSANSGATSRHLLRRRKARRIMRAPGSPASTRGPRLGASYANVGLGASCVFREVQRLSFSLSLSQRGAHVSAHRAPT